MCSHADQAVSVSMDLPLVLNRGWVEIFIHDICEGDLDLITDLVRIYLQSLDNLIGEMVSAWKTEDPILLRRAAHSLKSSSRIFGADLLAENCERLEKAAIMGEFASAPMLIERIVAQGQEMHHLLGVEFEGLGREA
jgi:HPt (histidine-containing phosphotransfer) domain-containing protein